MEEVTRVDEDRDSTAAHIEYVQENILELQNDLIAVEDSKVREPLYSPFFLPDFALPRTLKSCLGL